MLDMDQITAAFRYLGGAYIDTPENANEMELQAREHIGTAFKRQYRRDLSAAVTFTFIQIWYGFYPHQFTLQCVITTPEGLFMSDPYLWPMGNYATICNELQSRGA